jgi:hypothetical protein
MLAIKDGVDSIAFDLEHGMAPEGVGRRSVVENFNKRRKNKITAQGEKARAKEKVWEKNEKKKKNPKISPKSDDSDEQGENRAGFYEIPNSDDGDGSV